LVINRAGRTPSRQGVLTALRNVIERHGLPQRSFHSLRHYFCSALLSNGASAEAVRVLAGHGNLAVTQRYAHTNQVELNAAIQRFSGN
jgi:site-specific recombinase XerD